MNLPPVAILSGGLATRLRPITETIPKSLVEVAGRPFIDWQLELLAGQGVRRAVICAGYLGEMIEEHVGNGHRFGLDVAYSWDGEPLLGTGGALRKALPLLGDEFQILYGDSWLDIDYAAVVAAFRASGQPALMTVFRNEGLWDTSNVEFSDGRIQRYDKVDRTPAMLHIDYGLGVMKAEALEAWPNDQAFDLAALYGGLVKQGHLAGYEIFQRFYEVGSHQGLADLDALLRARRHGESRHG